MNSKFLDFKLWSGSSNHHQQQQQRVEQSIQDKVANCLQESNRNIQKMQQQQQQHHAKVLTQPPPQIQQQQQPQQQLETSVNLKDKLHGEISKIKEWKLTLDQEITEHKQKLVEKESILERNRLETKELTLKVETISLKLQEEYDQRSEVAKRIENTRDICNAMKDQVSRTEKICKKYEQVRDEVDELNSRRKNDLKQLERSFELLSDKANDAFKAFKGERERFRDQTEQLERKRDEERQEFVKVREGLNGEIRELEEVKATLDSQITTLKGANEILSDEKQSLLNAQENLQSNLMAEKKELSESRNRLHIESEKSLEKSNLLFALKSALSSQRTNLSEIGSIATANLSEFTQLISFLKEVFGETLHKIKSEIIQIKEKNEGFSRDCKENLIRNSNTIVDLNRNLRDLRDENVKLVQTLNGKNSLLEKFDQNIRTTLADLKILENETTELKECGVSIREELICQVRKINSKREEIQNSFHSMKQNQKDALEQVKKYVSDSISKLSVKTKSENLQRETISNLKDNLSRVERELTNERQEKSDLNDKLSCLTSKIKAGLELKGDIEEGAGIDALISDIQNFVDDKSQKIRDLEEKLESAEKEAKANVSEAEVRNSELEKLKKKSDKASEKKSRNLNEKEKQIEELNGKVKELNLEIEQLKRRQRYTAKAPPPTPQIHQRHIPPLQSNNDCPQSPELGSISSRPRTMIAGAATPRTAAAAAEGVGGGGRLCDTSPTITPNSLLIQRRRKRQRSAFDAAKAPARQSQRNQRIRLASQKDHHHDDDDCGDEGGLERDEGKRKRIPFDKLSVGGDDSARGEVSGKTKKTKRKSSWFDSDSVFGFGE